MKDAEAKVALKTALQEAVKSPVPRDQIIRSLQAVVAFINADEEMRRDNLGNPLWQLAVALDDLRNGIKSPIFDSGPVGTRMESRSRKQMKAYALYMVDALLQVDGIKLADAAKIVAKELEAGGFRVGNPQKGKSSDPTWTSVIEWRKRHSKMPDDDIEKTILAALRTLPPPPWPLTKDVAINRVRELIGYMKTHVAAFTA